MDNTLIIYAHPLKTGHSAFYLNEITGLLDARNEKYEILDLYEMDYDPVLKAENLDDRRIVTVAKQDGELQNKIASSSSLVFIYPVWWQNMPAVLKGFIDKIFVSGFAYKYEGSRPVGLMKGKKAVVLTSTGGPAFYSTFLSGNYAVKIMTKSTLGFCGIKSKAFLVGSARGKVSEKNKKLMQKHVKKAISFLYS